MLSAHASALVHSRCVAAELEGTTMATYFASSNASGRSSRAARLVLSALAAVALGACSQSPVSTADASSPKAGATEPEEALEYLARPEELASVSTTDILKSLRLNGEAMILGEQVYLK